MPFYTIRYVLMIDINAKGVRSKCRCFFFSEVYTKEKYPIQSSSTIYKANIASLRQLRLFGFVMVLGSQ